MRLIDADHLRKWIIANWGEGWHGKTVDDIIDQIDREDTYIEDANIVDAAPIRHGYWKRTSGSYVEWYECSECGSKASVFWGANSLTDYCPHCGAKMDKVEKKEIKKICILSNGTLKEEYDIPNVIRCKDCKYGSRDPYDMRPIWCFYCDRYRNEMDFCSRGEKKDE